MNNVSKSLLTGLATAILVFFLGDLFGKKVKDKYRISYTVDILPDPAAAYTLPYPEIKKILKKRLEATPYKHEMESLDSNTTRTTLHGVNDTSIYHLLASSGAHLQFRELYTMIEVKDMLMLLVDEMKKIADLKTTPASPTKKRDTTIRNGMAEDLPNTGVEDKAGSVVSLIDFSQPYGQEQGMPGYPAEIGYVKLKDTAELMKLLHSPEIAAAAPAGLQLCFGVADKNKRVKTEVDRLVPLYCIRTYGREKANLENEDILDAGVDYDQAGRISINFKFKKLGARKWADMTRNNIGRSIAMILDDVVVSAPRVNDAIVDGSSSISGNYTPSEAQDLSYALLSKKFPAKLIVSAVDIKQEHPGAAATRKLLITAVAFVLAAAIAFFVFKTLRPR